MKKKFLINIILCLILPLNVFSWIGTELKGDTLRSDEVYLLIPRSAIDRANADAELCDWFKEQLPNALVLKDLYKKGYKISLKLDTLQTAEIVQADKIIYLTDENYHSIKKTLKKRKIEDVLNSLNKPVILGIGIIFGFLGGRIL